jgi:hypothetical protein
MPSLSRAKPSIELQKEHKTALFAPVTWSWSKHQPFGPGFAVEQIAHLSPCCRIRRFLSSARSRSRDALYLKRVARLAWIPRSSISLAFAFPNSQLLVFKDWTTRIPWSFQSTHKGHSHFTCSRDVWTQGGMWRLNIFGLMRHRAHVRCIRPSHP